LIESQAALVLASLKPSSIVLDVGGWACPFNRATHVIDEGPYETRGHYRMFGMPASQGGDLECFTADTWVRRDICEKAPWPWPDGFFDFVICAQTLEDVRDPLWVCQEMMRVGRRGYIEVPSRMAESCRGWEHPRTVGLCHHRWLITIGDGHIEFAHKPHCIHQHWRLSFPPSVLRRLTEAECNQWLWWTGEFSYSERVMHGVTAYVADLEDFVRAHRPYPPALLSADRLWRTASTFARRVRAKLRRTMANAARLPSVGSLTTRRR